MQAGLLIGSDILPNLLFSYEAGIRSHNYLFLKASSLGIGAVYQYEKPHSYQEDHILGVGLLWSDEWCVEISAGIFQRKYQDIGADGFTQEPFRGSGIGGIVLIGRNFGKYFRIVVPIVTKFLSTVEEEIESEQRKLSKQWSVEVIPYFGARLEI